MEILNMLIDYLISQDFSVAWAVISALIGYVIYYQHQSCKDMNNLREELFSLLRENKYRHNKIEDDIRNLRQTVKEDITPILRKMESDLRELEDLSNDLNEIKTDERGWFNSLHDDFNQFRSEFRDILKLVLNGRKADR